MPTPSPTPFGRRLLQQLRRRRASRPSARSTRVVRLEPLEERNLLTTFYVTNNDDSGDGSLRQAIITANETPGPDTIHIAEGLSDQIQLESQLVITDDLTIRGPGADRLAISGVPGLPDSTSGGAGFGGAILSGDFSPFGKGDSRLEVSRSEFVGNSALGGAGLDGTDQDAALAGGAAAGGAISVGNLGDAELKRNTFRRNTAVGGDGGAGASGGVATGGGVSGAGASEEFGEQTTLELERNDFLYNSAEGGAGATGRGGGLGLDTILGLAGFFPGVASAEVDGDSYVGNVAYGGTGGGILVYQGTAEIAHASVTHNRAVGGEGGLGAGGGVFFFGFADVVAELAYSILAHNSASGGQGGDGFGGGLIAGSLGAGGAVQVSVSHGVVFNNIAKGGRGGDGLRRRGFQRR